MPRRNSLPRRPADRPGCRCAERPTIASPAREDLRYIFIADEAVDDSGAPRRRNDDVEITDGFLAAAIAAGDRSAPNALNLGEIAQQRLRDVFGDRPLDPWGDRGAFFGLLQDPLLPAVFGFCPPTLRLPVPRGR